METIRWITLQQLPDKAINALDLWMDSINDELKDKSDEKNNVQ